MEPKLLITLGCSWTYGVGVNYVSGMSPDELMKTIWDPTICDNLSWRGVLSRKINAKNYNLSAGGSSNQKQFRLATEFFSSRKFSALKESNDQILVLWGITSTARNEIFSLEKNELYNFFLTEKQDKFGEFFLKHIYNHDYEVYLLRLQMLHWNDFFKNIGIKNYWFDTFNTHDYTNIPGKEKIKERYNEFAGPDWPKFSDFINGNFTGVPEKTIVEIKNQLDLNELPTKTRDLDNLIDGHKNPRDIAFCLAANHGFTDFIHDDYHLSTWQIDSKKIQFLVDKELINPISLHPTKASHEKIADIFLEKIYG